MKQNAEIRFNCKSEEKEKIKQKAEKAGMTIKSFLLYLGLNANVKNQISE